MVHGDNFGLPLSGGDLSRCVFVPWRSRNTALPLRCDGLESWAGEGEIFTGYIDSWGHSNITFCMPHGLGALDVAVYSAGQWSPLRAANATPPAAGPGFAYNDPEITRMSDHDGPALGAQVVTLSTEDTGVGLAPLTSTGGGGGGGGSTVPRISLPYPLPLPSNWQPPWGRGLRIEWGGSCIAVPPGTMNETAPAPGTADCARGRITAQTHDSVSFLTRAGLGSLNLSLSVIDGDGRVFSSSAATAPSVNVGYTYLMPVLTGVSPANGTTLGGPLITLSGSDLTANGGIGQALRVNWGPQLSSLFGEDPGGFCAATLPRVNGTRQCGNYTVQLTTFGGSTGRRVTFPLPPGVGRALPVSVSLIDEDGAVVAVSNVLDNFSYAPPRLRAFAPNPVLLGGESPTVLATGSEFGLDWVIARYREAGAPAELTALALGFNDGDPFMLCAGVPPARIVRGDDTSPEPTVSFCLNHTRATVGYHNVSVTTAGQTGTLDAAEEGALLVGCQPGHYGTVGEPCLPCPKGAACAGFVSDVTFALQGSEGLVAAVAALGLSVDTRTGGVHWYPRPLPGFYNLNGSQAAACPVSALVPGRDVCVVACTPAEACAGDNVCALGYLSKPPLFRCATCAKSYYKRSGECIKCPDSPVALVIGFLVLLALGAGGAYLLNKKNINIAFLSIGIDYAQVVAIFASAKVPWPPALKNLFQILSAFNLNIEVVTPECLNPDLTYVQKFTAIMLLPVVLAALFLGVHGALVAYKALVKGRRRNLTRHTAPLVSALLLLSYMIYLFLVRTTLDVFNCQPAEPPDFDADGRLVEYLQVTNEPCGVPGGTQRALVPGAIAAAVVYVLGYPALLAGLFWARRELIVEDQLLRAKGVGNERLENPNAYATRRAFSRVYYMYKPDYYWWNLLVLGRKFGIAFVSLMFARNASFQLAACIVVLFTAYALQTHFNPFMPPSECESVLRDHETASLASGLHARLRVKLAAIQSRGRKRTRANVMTPAGRVDIKALLGRLSSSMYSYNTVEAVMLASAIIVALMGILFDASATGATSYSGRTSAEAVSSVVITVIVLTLVYFFSVVFTEVYVLWGEAERREAMRKGRASALKLDGKGGASLTALRKAVAPRGGGAAAIGAVTSENNPIFIAGATAGATAAEVAAFTGDRQALVDALSATTTAPSAAMWALFRATFLASLEQVDGLQLQLLHAGAAAAGGRAAAPTVCTVCGSSSEAEVVGGGGRSKHAFVPVAASSAPGASGGVAAPDLSAFRSSRSHLAPPRA